jgi:sulfite dehydrogenase
MRACSLVLAFSLLPGTAAAEDATPRLPPETAALAFVKAPNSELVREVCLECHSADYVTTQPAQTRTSWKATLDRMRNAFGMEAIGVDEENRILDYLTSYYGRPG